MIILGIDPGGNGAFTFMSGDGKIIEIRKMPTMSDNSIDRCEVFNIMKSHKVDMVCIEQCQYTPKMTSGTAIFSFGRNVEIPHSMAVALGLPIMFAHPAKWKRMFGLIKKDKNQSCIVAAQLFPEKRNCFIKSIPNGTSTKNVYYDGTSESALIAEWCRREGGNFD